MVAGVLATAGLVVLPGSAAFAQQSTVSGAVAASWQTNSTVWAIAAANNVVYVGGDFTSVRPPGAVSGTGEVSRSRLAAFNATTGALITTFNHAFNGSVRSLAFSPDKATLYVGGDFTTADGVARSRVAAYTVAGNGTLTSWAPNPDGRVAGIAVSSANVYLAGGFGRIGTTPRRLIASLSPTTGAIRTQFAPNFDNSLYGLDLNAAGDRLYVAGAFNSLNGDTTKHGAVPLDPTTGDPMSFPAGTVIPVHSDACDSVIRAITHDANGSYFAAEGTGGGCFDGTFGANNDGSLKWISRCLGATQGIAVVNGELFAGSHAHDCTADQGFDPDAFPEVGWSKGLSRHLTSRSAVDGKVGAWSPNTNGGPNGAGLGPRVLATDGSQVFVGGEFTHVNGSPQQGFARFASNQDAAPARPAAPRAVVRPDGKVSVFVNTPLDTDDKDLTVRFYRDGASSPFATQDVHAMFWRNPIAKVEDNGLVLGSSHTYTVDVVGKNGTAVSPKSSASNRITVATSAGAYSDSVNADNPSLFWRLGENAGSTIAADSGAALNPGEVKGTTTFGQAGANAGDTAANFDGSTANVVTQTAIPGPTTYSVEAWFKTTTTTGGKIIGFGNNRTALDFGGNTTQSGAYDRNVYMLNDGRIRFGSYDGGFNVVTSSTAFNDGQWHQVVGTQGAAGTTLYVDGARLARNGNPNNQGYDGYWRVGGDNLGAWPDQPSSNFFTGTIDDVAVYPSALSLARVQAHYTASGRTAPPGPPVPSDTYGAAVVHNDPLYYWRLDETSGATANDSSGNQENGIYVGGPTQGRPSAIGGFGTSVGFDGSDDNVASGTATSVGSTFSTEAWFRSQPGTGGGKIVGFGNQQTGYSSNYDKHTYLSDDGRVIFGVWNGNADVLVSNPGYNDGQWHHVVSTQSSAGMRLYIDDHLIGSNGITTNQGYGGYWRVGGDTLGWPFQGSSKYFQGDVDDVAIYASALTANDVDDHYRASGRSGPDTVAPSASITSPADGAAIPTGATPVTVDASDNVGVTSVEVFVDGSSVGTDSSAPYSVSWNATPGSHQVVAKATDAAGNVGTSSTVTVTATAPDTTDPTVAITSPADGASVYGPVTVAADASDDTAVTSVTFRVDGTSIGTDTSAPYTAAWGATDVGSHTLTATAVDAAGNSSTSTVHVTVPADTTAPSAPSGLTSSDVSQTSVKLSWTASTDDRGVTGYRVVRNGTVLPGTVTGLTFTDSGLAAGTAYTYTVRAVDAAGNVSDDSNTVSVTTTAATPVVFTDDWNRPDGNGWGASWTVGSASGTVVTSGATGRLTFEDIANSYARAQLTGLSARTDTETLLSFRWDQTTALSYLNVYTRGSGGWQNAYRPRTGVGLQLSSTSRTVTAQQNVNGTTTNLLSTTNAQTLTTAKQWLRLRVDGGTLQYRIWTDGDAEPAAWTATVTGVPSGAGQVFVSAVRGTSNTGAKAVSLDDLSITDLNP
ncbi:Ig-like domain-containing protein [Angustibacter peucedani]